MLPLPAIIAVVSLGAKLAEIGLNRSASEVEGESLFGVNVDKYLKLGIQVFEGFQPALHTFAQLKTWESTGHVPTVEELEEAFAETTRLHDQIQKLQRAPQPPT